MEHLIASCPPPPRRSVKIASSRTAQQPPKRCLGLSKNVVSVELSPSARVSPAIGVSLIEVGTMVTERDFVTEPKSMSHEEELKGDICYSENDLEGALFHYDQAIFLNDKESMYKFKKAACLERLNLCESLKFVQGILTKIEGQIRKANEVSTVG
eukprot:Protomagalhaensia_wolfi_Nauph_80__1917@NODE_2201_length_1172_cov_6_620477_g1720_i0_p2_GENE_NODE_2201_length_1172_cov_6_620477_g1720_i0NODE_2201_length_1172_cov_6_620477_g1720_i0_p2_ORF_typecomplete_len155_score28_65TPR_2/PF07719_17/0_073ANAPC3/PF12895_7/0_067TPR_21/PF09976_9/0_1_NODE_2201_length_1172_cov_6_620477_g1720_i041505